MALDYFEDDHQTKSLLQQVVDMGDIVEVGTAMGTLFEQCLSIMLNTLVLMMLDAKDLDSATMLKLHANLE